MVVLPGEYVGANEEYMPSIGTFSAKTGVYSSAIGELALDAKSHLAKIKKRTRIPKLQGVGIVVLGQVAETTDSVAIVDLVKTDIKNMSYVPNGISAILHVSNIKSGYVEDLRDELKIGDMVRVKIIEANEHTTKLTISFKELGVIKAYCSVCREPLRMSGAKLVCGRCGNVEQRKTAEDYGSISLG